MQPVQCTKYTNQKKVNKENKMKQLSKQDAKRIQSGTAKQNGGKISKGSWAAKAQSITDKRASNK